MKPNDVALRMYEIKEALFGVILDVNNAEDMLVIGEQTLGEMHYAVRNLKEALKEHETTK